VDGFDLDVHVFSSNKNPANGGAVVEINLEKRELSFRWARAAVSGFPRHVANGSILVSKKSECSADSFAEHADAGAQLNSGKYSHAIRAPSKGPL
jgi:hypothetical protein